MKPDSCLGCPLYDAPGPVFGDGPERAQLMIIGEAPGKDEVLVGKPFIGGSGRILGAMLKQAGVSRFQCYVTNVVKCRPYFVTAAGEKDRRPSEDEIRHCSGFLKAELSGTTANCILLLGDTALSVLTGRNGISKYRGVPFESGGRKVLATFHPAYVMRQQSLFPIPIWDIKRAAEEATKGPTVARAAVQYNTNARVGVDGPALARSVRETGTLYFDIESTDLDPRTSQVICLGLAATPFAADCYPWSPEVAAFAGPLFADPTIEHVGQNSESFDIPFLEVKGLTFGPKSFDTMLAFHLTNSDLPKDLGFISTFYVDFDPWKSESGKDLFLYNCKDVDATARTAVGLKAELQTLEMEDLYYKTVMPLQPVLRRIQANGLRMDLGKAGLWAKLIAERAKQKTADLRAALGLDFDPHSPKVVMKLLYDTMGLPVQYTRDRVRGLRPTADAKAIATLVELFPENKILLSIADVRSAQHTISTNLELKTDEQDKVHPRFGCAKAANGRLNSWDPNGQNIPLALREVYVPDTPDHVFIEADWSQIEWRAAMVLSSDPHGLGLLVSGKDNHKAVASEALDIPYDEVTDARRHEAKFIVYGLGYGRGAESIAKQHHRELSFVQTFIRNFSRRFDTYWKWRSRLEKLVEANFFLRNPFGRRRWWYSRQVTEMYNYPPSSTAADMMYEALIELDRQLPGGATIRNSVHDAVLVCAHKDVAKQAYDCIQTLMQRTWPIIVDYADNPKIVKHFYPQGWHCPVDIHIGTNWRETKKGNSELERKLLGGLR